MDAATEPSPPMAVRIASSSGAVRVYAEDRPDVHVDGSATTTEDGHTVTVEASSGRVTVRVPLGADLVVGAESGSVKVSGPVGHVAVTCRSGRVIVHDVESTDIRAESGRVEVRGCRDECRVRDETGRVTVTDCGSADVVTRSGRITVAGVRGDVRAHCVSGRVAVDLDQAANVDAETVSGRIEVRYPPGVTARRADDPELVDGDCVVNARAVSGRVTVGTR